jgi:hypothetical protein
VAFADYPAYLQVTNTRFIINNAWPILYAPAILYLPPCRFTVTALVILLALLTKMRIKVAAYLLIRSNIKVNIFMANQAILICQ